MVYPYNQRKDEYESLYKFVLCIRIRTLEKK